MAGQVLLNNVTTKLTSQLLTGGTTANVTAGSGALFADATGGNYIRATLVRISGFKEVAWEIVYVTARSTDALTITRAREGTTALQFEIGDTLEVRMTAKTRADVTGIWCGTAGGTANALTLTPATPILAYEAGMSFVFVAGATTNDSAVTFAVSGLSTIAGQVNGRACTGREIPAGKLVRITLDTTTTAQIEHIDYRVGDENILYNGNMMLWQSYTAAVTATGGYGADGFVVRTSGDTFSMTQQAFASGDDLYDGDGTAAARYYTQVDVTSVAGAGNFAVLEQRVEDVRRLAGKTVTLSFWAKAAAGTPQIGIGATQYFGTGGSPSANASISGQAITLSTTWAKYTVTFTVTNINGKTIGTDENSFTYITFWLDAGSTYNTASGSIGQASKIVSIAQVKLQEGSVATPFIAEDREASLVRAQRYFQLFNSTVAYCPFGEGIAISATTAVVHLKLPTTMRITPTAITQSGTAANYAVYNGSNIVCSAVPTIRAAESSPNTVALTVTVASGLTAGQFVQLSANNTTAAYIGVSARL